MQKPLVLALLVSALTLSAASGQHIKRATLSSKSGAVVSSQEADASGKVTFTGVRPGEYKLTLVNSEGRSVTIGDLDGDGHLDCVVADPAPQAGVKSPRDIATGQASGKRQHQPVCCVVDWNGTVKGGFSSEMDAQSAGKRMPSSAAGACAVKVACDVQPGTIEVSSYSWDLATSKK